MSGWTLACSECGYSSAPRPLAALCPECEAPLLVTYELPAEPEPPPAAWRARRRADGIWRYRELLPLADDETPITLGEGGTPLLPLPETGRRLGVRLYVKQEGGNPTGSFKDRGMAAAVTRAVLDGAERFVLPSAGNAAVALAACAARAGRPATVFLPADTPDVVEARCRVYGADVRNVAGLISDCGTASAAFASETGAIDLSTLREPYRIEGKKTMGLEILEDLAWRPPDAVVYPAGGGTGLIGTWKALREAGARGWLVGGDAPSTRMYAVQSEGCAPVVRAWERGDETAEPWADARTAAWGLRVPSARGDRLMLRTLRASGGGAVAVSDDEMRRSARAFGRRDGVAIGIEGGAAAAAVERLVERGDLRSDDTVVLFNTGNLTNYGWYDG